MQTDAVFAGSIPAVYDRCLGPAIFAPYAADLASRLTGLRTGVLLETASGTGIATRALSELLPEAVRIVATDLNQPMLDFASSRLISGRIERRQADALHLPFGDGTFDAVICQFGVMFFPDKISGYREALRVLKPGGRFIFNVWDQIAANEVADIVTGAVAALFPDDPPQFLARTPHGLYDTTIIRRELQEAGFGRVRVETLSLRSHAQSYRDPAVGFCQGTPLRSEIEMRAPGRLTEVTDAAAAAIAARFGNGAIDTAMSAHIVEASR